MLSFRLSPTLNCPSTTDNRLTRQLTTEPRQRQVHYISAPDKHLIKNRKLKLKAKSKKITRTQEQKFTHPSTGLHFALGPVFSLSWELPTTTASRSHSEAYYRSYLFWPFVQMALAWDSAHLANPRPRYRCPQASNHELCGSLTRAPVLYIFQDGWIKSFIKLKHTQY